MNSRIKDGLILTGIGVVGTVGLVIVGVPVPFQSGSIGTSVAQELERTMAYTFGLIFLLIGVTSLLDIYPGWGFQWGKSG